MEPAVEIVDDVAIVVIPDETLDASNSPEFKRDIGALLEGYNKVIFDLTNVRFVDSSGCGAILSCLRQLNRKGGDLKLCRVQKSVLALFELVRMHRIFEIVETREQALEAFGSNW